MTEHHASRSTIDDVARLAGVSTATVSRALRDHPYVTAATKSKVLAAVESLRYVANSNASRLASGQSRTVGLIAPMLTSWYTTEVIVGVEEVLAEARYDLLIGTANPAARQRMFNGDARFQQHTDGVILVDVFCGDDGARRLAKLDAPVVVLGEHLSTVTSASVDNGLGARLAAEHLIALGHRRIALVGGHTEIDVAHNVPQERETGFREALAAADIDLPDEYVADGDFTIEGGRRTVLELLDLPTPPTAVFMMSDEMAFGALWALRERGLQVGVDLSVVGFDDHPVAAAVGLTTVRQPVRDLGRLGARLMLDALAGIAPDGSEGSEARAPRHHAIDITLEVRTSSGPPT